MPNPKLILLVDDILPSGKIVTLSDRLKEHHLNWQPNIYDRVIQCYRKYCVDQVQFMPLRELNEPEPGVNYAYFIPMNDWHWTMQQVFFMISRDDQRKLANANASIYFCQDMEMYPNVNFSFLGDYLGIVRLFQSAHGNTGVKIKIGMMATLAPDQDTILKKHFGDSIDLVHSPMSIPYSRDAILTRYQLQGLELDVDSIFEEYLTTPKERDFLCLNRDPKLSRLLMLHALRANGLLNYGFVSNLVTGQISGAPDYNGDDIYLQRLYEDIKKGPLPKMEVDSLKKGEVDAVSAVRSGAAGFWGTAAAVIMPLDHMRASCYDVVQETTTSSDRKGLVNQGVVTEKVIKSLMFGRPFVVNGGPRVLEVLRRWGFNTCDYLFDESYDQEVSLLYRQKTIIENAVRWKGRRAELMRRITDNADRLRSSMRRVQNFPVEQALVEALAGK